MQLDSDLPRNAAAPAKAEEPIIRVRDVVVGFGDRIILKGLSLDVAPMRSAPMARRPAPTRPFSAMAGWRMSMRRPMSAAPAA